MTSNCDQVKGHVTPNGPTQAKPLVFTEERDVFASPLPSATNRTMSMVVSEVNSELKSDTSLKTPRPSENGGAADSFNKHLSMPDLSSSQTRVTDRPNLYKKLENFKLWSVSTYKCTKQVIEEKIGTSVPTYDHNLDIRIESLKQMQKHYQLLLDAIKLYSANLTKLVLSQQQMLTQFNFLGQQQPELENILTSNADAQRSSSTNGEKLLAALDVVQNGLTTLVNQTMEDTMLTIRNMNMARLEFDAYRKEADLLRQSPRKSANTRRVTVTLERLSNSENQFNRLKSAVDAKLWLLDENRVRVMNHNLSLLHEAASAYYSGGEQKLNDTLKHFSVKVLQSFPPFLSSPISTTTTTTSTANPNNAVQYDASTHQNHSNFGDETNSQSYVHFPYAPNNTNAVD